MKRSVILGAGACAVAIAVTSCSSEGIYGVPLPGGPDIGDHPMHLTIQFDDVLDLVPQSAVKVDGVPVGRVETIKVAPDGWTMHTVDGTRAAHIEHTVAITEEGPRILTAL